MRDAMMLTPPLSVPSTIALVAFHLTLPGGSPVSGGHNAGADGGLPSPSDSLKVFAREDFSGRG